MAPVCLDPSPCARAGSRGRLSRPPGDRPLLFPTLEFALFLCLVLSLNWLLMPRRRAWLWFALVVSYWFYGAWDWRFLGLLGGSTLLNQAIVGRLVASQDPSVRKRWLVLGVGLNLSTLAFFKYFNFLFTNLANALALADVALPPPAFNVILPVGISFFTFQALSYVVDVYRGSIKPVSTLEFAVYLAFFPQLVAGPIVRASDFLPQLAKPRRPLVAAPRAARLILLGLAKKVILADFLAVHIVDAVFTHPERYGALDLLVGLYGYAAQIYCDFSAYSDIAIGVALLLGFSFPDNFDRPYTATSLQDFWRRWHLSLSSWLRDYLYIPLGGNRGGRLGTYRNLMLTMLLGGLWHGASWMFVIWGGIHGAGLALERWLGERGRGLRPAPSLLGRILQRTLTFHLVCLAWLFFRAPSMRAVGDFLSGFARFEAPTLITPLLLAVLALGLFGQFLPRGWFRQLELGIARVPLPAAAALCASGLMLIDVLGPQGVAAFIYFQF